MKYIRTKKAIREIINDYDTSCSVKSNHRKTIGGFTVIWGLHFAPRADTIEELCDYIIIFKDNKPWVMLPCDEHNLEMLKELYQDYEKRFAIWTDKGLIYVAKMNEEGNLELL